MEGAKSAATNQEIQRSRLPSVQRWIPSRISLSVRPVQKAEVVVLFVWVSEKVFRSVRSTEERSRRGFRIRVKQVQSTTQERSQQERSFFRKYQLVKSYMMRLPSTP